MSTINLIAAVDEQYGLGFNNELLCHLPADLKYFKALTLGHPIIMGRKTFESIGRPLPGRRNIVLSKTAHSFPQVETVNTLAKAIDLLVDIKEIFIIGGAAVFQEALPMADRIYLTVIHHQFKADVFFPQLSEKKWHCTRASFHEKDDKNPYDMTFSCYERVSGISTDALQANEPRS